MVPAVVDARFVHRQKLTNETAATKRNRYIRLFDFRSIRTTVDIDVEKGFILLVVKINFWPFIREHIKETKCFALL